MIQCPGAAHRAPGGPHGVAIAYTVAAPSLTP